MTASSAIQTVSTALTTALRPADNHTTVKGHTVS